MLATLSRPFSSLAMDYYAAAAAADSEAIFFPNSKCLWGPPRLVRSSSTAVRRHCTDWYEIWALTDHEIYYIKIELDLRKFSIGPFSETEKGFWVNPTPGGSQCTGLSPTLSWKWPRATLSPSFGPFFERNHSFEVKMVWENLRKCFKSCPSWSWNPTGKKQIYTTGKRSYRTGHICKLFHFALSLLNSEVAITPERVARLTWFFGSMPKIKIYDHLFHLF